MPNGISAKAGCGIMCPLSAAVSGGTAREGTVLADSQVLSDQVLTSIPFGRPNGSTHCSDSACTVLLLRRD